MKERLFAFLLVVLGGLAACRGAPVAPSPTPSSLPARTLQAPALPTASPSPLPSPTPTPTVRPSPTPSPLPRRFTVVFTGNIVPARCVQDQVDRRGGDPAYLYQAVAPLLQSADLAVGGGLAATLSDAAPPTGCRSTFILMGRPQHAQALAQAGLDLIAVPTNHIKDCNGPNCNEQAFLDTLDHLRAAGIVPIGAGRDLDEALEPAVVEIQGVKVGFVALGELRPRNFAGPDKPGIAPLTEANVRESIGRARARGAEFVVALPHWGPEYEPRPSYLQQATARMLVEAGADLVVGNHAHVIQGMEVVQGVPVFYGLGSFLFDQNWGRETRYSLLLRAYFEGPRLVAWEVIPLAYDPLTFAVHPLRGQEAQAVLQRFWEASLRLVPTPTLPVWATPWGFQGE